MAITSGASLVEKGTQTEVINDTAAVADGAFSAGTITPLIPADKVSLGDAVLAVTMAVTPAAGAYFHLYRRDKNIDGVNHAPVPDANYKSIYLGSFMIDLINTVQYINLIGIPLSGDQEFYLENDTGQATTGTTALKIILQAYNVKA